MSEKNLSGTEKIKMASNGLRGTVKESLLDEITGAIREDDTALIKFHGLYQQDDRDRREERAMKKLDRLYSFMIRARIPGGFLTPDKWIAIHNVAGENSTGVIKITTRQTIQLHGVIKAKIKPTIHSFDQAGLHSIATCGDVNRNVTCTAHPNISPLFAKVFSYTNKITELLLPKTRAYYEIWLDHEKIVDRKDEEDPLYQDRFMPRKFKIGIGIPPNNDVDVLTNDLGLIAIIEDNELKGFNVAIGGGLSTTHGYAETYARLATVIGFVPEDKILPTVYEVLTVQRDYGNRSDRKLARLKYTVDRLGVDKYREEVEKRTGFPMEPARPYKFTNRADLYGWVKNENGRWYYTLFIENGRVVDEQVPIKSGLLEIAKTGKANFVFTSSQNVIISDVAEEDKARIDEILQRFQLLEHTNNASAIRKNAIACVALPTCPLALGEAQRYMPSLISKIEPLLVKHNLQDEEIIMRMTGCPNGCARSYAAEIGLIGTAVGKYNLNIGGDHYGERLNKLYRANLDEAGILEALDGLFAAFKNERKEGENFGDYTLRTQVA
jgi:sulfite reductase (NADPH) hemoprotein beta-component